MASENYDVAKFLTYLHEQPAYSEIRLIDEHRWACVCNFMFTHAILTGRVGQYSVYDDRWCYSTFESAKTALDAWDGSGEPAGWHRHPNTGRRREFDETGEVSVEYVNP